MKIVFSTFTLLIIVFGYVTWFPLLLYTLIQSMAAAVGTEDQLEQVKYPEDIERMLFALQLSWAMALLDERTRSILLNKTL